VQTMEIGVITPPVGMNVYVLKSVIPDMTLEEIFQGTSWMLVIQIICLIILLIFPAIAMFLPGLMLVK